MPRNYRNEYDSYHSKPKQKKRRAQRNAARRKLKALGRVRPGDGRKVDHRDGNTGRNTLSNLRVVSKKKNRSFKRTEKARKAG